MRPTHAEARTLAFQQQTQHHGGMPVSITIRNVPSDVRDELAARAARSGQSLQEYLLARLEVLAAKPDPADVIARARERVRRTGVGVTTEQILEALRRDRE
jgi:plasmid stability protein